MKKPAWVIGAILPILVISFQNCGSQVSFEEVISKADLEPVSASSIDTSTSNNEAQGSGGASNPNLPEDEVEMNGEIPRQSQLEVDQRVDPVNTKKECVEGQELLVYIDPQGDGMIREENYLGSFVSYQGMHTAKDNMNYYSASVHPMVGPTPLGYEANIFMYEGSDGLSFNFFANVDEGGSDDNTVDLDILVDNNSYNDMVLLSDDSGELKKKQNGLYEGRFRYWKNTDGGSIGPFNTADNFTIRVQFKTTGDIQKARFHSANGLSFSLATTATPVNDFIITNNKKVNCKVVQ